MVAGDRTPVAQGFMVVPMGSKLGPVRNFFGVTAVLLKRSRKALTNRHGESREATLGIQVGRSSTRQPDSGQAQPRIGRSA
jgi:hypothetical protein